MSRNSFLKGLELYKVGNYQEALGHFKEVIIIIHFSALFFGDSESPCTRLWIEEVRTSIKF